MEETKPIRSTSISFISDTNNSMESDLSRKLYSLTGYYSDDFDNPVKTIGRVFEIWSDESIFGEHLCVSLVASDQSQREKIRIANGKLHNLIKEYGLAHIHFTEIFGRKSVLKDPLQIKDFMEKYIEIVKQIKLEAYFISQSKKEIEERYGLGKLTKEDIFHNIFLECFSLFSYEMVDNDIVMIYKEQSNNYDDEYVRLIHKSLWIGIDTIKKAFPNKYLSICKFPQEFSKRNLIKSSVSDLAAYASCKLQSKIDNGIPLKKIAKEYELLIKACNDCFKVKVYPSLKFVDLVSNDSKLKKLISTINK